MSRPVVALTPVEDDARAVGRPARVPRRHARGRDGGGSAAVGAITQSAYSVPTVWRTNAIRVPSGEYAGSASGWPSLVSVTAPEPSGRMLTISSLPDAPETTARRPLKPAAPAGRHQRARAGGGDDRRDAALWRERNGVKGGARVYARKTSNLSTFL